MISQYVQIYRVKKKKKKKKKKNRMSRVLWCEILAGPLLPEPFWDSQVRSHFDFLKVAALYRLYRRRVRPLNPPMILEPASTYAYRKRVGTKHDQLQTIRIPDSRIKDVLSVRVPPAELNISAFPQVQAPQLGNQRPWYAQPRLCDWAYKRSRATYR